MLLSNRAYMMIGAVGLTMIGFLLIMAMGPKVEPLPPNIHITAFYNLTMADGVPVDRHFTMGRMQDWLLKEPRNDPGGVLGGVWYEADDQAADRGTIEVYRPGYDQKAFTRIRISNESVLFYNAITDETRDPRRYSHDAFADWFETYLKEHHVEYVRASNKVETK